MKPEGFLGPANVIKIGRLILSTAVDLWGFFCDVYASFHYNHGTMTAAAISYYAYLSAVPTLLLAVAGWGYLLGSNDQAQSMVLLYISNISPALVGEQSVSITKLVNELISLRGPATLVGTLGLLWGGTGVIVILDKAMNRSFGITESRGFIKGRLFAVVLLPFMTLLFGLSFIGTSLLRIVKNVESHVVWLKLSKLPFVAALSSYAVPFAITTIAFLIVFFVLPRKQVPLKAAISGAFFTSIVWEFTKQIFGYYATNFARYNRIYGSLGTLILLMVWINISALIAIMGAEFAAALTRRIEGKERSKEKNESLSSTR